LPWLVPDLAWLEWLAWTWEVWPELPCDVCMELLCTAWVEAWLLELPGPAECSCFVFFVRAVVVVDCVVVTALVLAVSAHAPSVSPCATCAATAGRAMLIVCDLPEPVMWQTSTFSCPPASSPAVFVSCAEVVVPPVAPVDVDSLPPFSWSKSSMSSLVSSAESFSSPLAVELVVDDGMLVELSVEALLVDGSEVICARPTPAAAAKASPATTPTMERRLNRLNRLCTLNPFDLRWLGLRHSVAATARNLRCAVPRLRESSARLCSNRHEGRQSVGFEQYHEPPAELSSETRTFARMIASLTEETEAINWYEQRMSLESDEEAKAIMANAQIEEFKHFGMDLEFLLRRQPTWRAELKRILFTDGDIVEAGEQAEEEVDS
jgi:uncharacterized protein